MNEEKIDELEIQLRDARIAKEICENEKLRKVHGVCPRHYQHWDGASFGLGVGCTIMVALLISAVVHSLPPAFGAEAKQPLPQMDLTGAPVTPMDAQGILMAARSTSGKAVVIQADDDGHVICSSEAPR